MSEIEIKAIEALENIAAMGEGMDLFGFDGPETLAAEFNQETLRLRLAILYAKQALQQIEILNRTAN